MPTPAHGERIKYRPDIDGLRALAILPVILYHAGLKQFGGGYVGVDVFFVISGFLITSLIAPEIAAGRFSLLQFYERRIRRIFPALYLVVACTLPAALILLLPTPLRQYGQSLGAMSLFSSNFLFWHEAGYFDASSYSKPLLHTWSLAVEEQFYIFFPLLLFALTKVARSSRVWVLAGIAVVSLAAADMAIHHDITAAFYGPHLRAWELLAGCLIALLPGPALPSFLAELLCALGVTLIAYAVCCFSPATLFPGLNALIPVAGATLVILSGDASTILVGPVLRSRPIVFVGKISYSAYLWHWPIMVFLTYFLMRNLNVWEITGVAAATMALASASWHWIENPARKINTSRKRIFAIAAGAMSLSMVAGAWLQLAHGLANRYATNPEPVAVEQFGLEVCFLWKSPASAWIEHNCTFPARENTAPRVFLWGDSFAAQYFSGLQQLQKSHDFTLVYAAMTTCAPLRTAKEASPECVKFNNRILNLILAERPKMVIWAGRWDAVHRKLDIPEAEPDILRMTAAGIHVLIVGESPVYLTPIPQQYVMDGLRGRHDTRFSPAHPLTENGVLARMANEANAAFFDPSRFLCRNGKCTIFDGKLLYSDKAHLGAHGSEEMAEAMLPLLDIKQ